MKLVRMALENFKGIKSKEFRFDGYDANIYGANGTGKTTIFDAFTWLMFGKSSEERANFSPKTITKNGYAHNLDHSVECDIEIDGEVTTFKRVYHEVYKKTRGYAEAVLSGHTTDYWINGVPKKEKEYQRFWQDIFPNDEVVKMLTMPFYFAEQLHWEKRRGLLLEICGNVSDLAIMETDSELSELEKLLGKRTVDEFKKSIKSSKAEINRKLELIPARIDEAKKAIPKRNTSATRSELEEKLNSARADIANLEKERAAIISGNESTIHIREEIAELNAKLAEAKAEHTEKRRAASESALEKVQEIRVKLQEAESDLTENTRTLNQSKQRVLDIEKKREEIMEAHRAKQVEYSEKQSEQFDESSTICDKCGQLLPADKVQDLKALFNERKSNRLSDLTKQMEDLVEQGKMEASKDMLAEAKEQAETYSGLVEANEGTIVLLKGKLEEAQLAAKKAELPAFETTEEYADITKAIDNARNRETAGKPDMLLIDDKIAQSRKAEQDISAEISAIDTEETQAARIEELEQEERELGAQYEEQERALYLCEKFTRVKSSLLNDKINEKFKTVRFQLFKQNITNDGIDDICDVLVPTQNGALVPFSDANKAARLNAGIEIIGVLGEHYGLELPVFVDNAESVSHIIPTKTQIIRLVVSESDKELRLETL